MRIQRFFRRAVAVTAMAVATLVCHGAAHAASDPVILSTGATITPDAAPGSFFQPLTVALPDYPNYLVDSAETTAVSPDGKTLLILTSGFNLNLDKTGNFQPSDSGEFIFVYDISSPATPAQKQVLTIPNAFSGLVWSPDGTKFYVAGGQDDNVHVFAQSNNQWAEAGTPIALNHPVGQSFVGPSSAGLGITADGKTLVVANYESDSISVVDLTKAVKVGDFDLRPGKINPAQAGIPGGEFPFWVAVKGNTVYVSSQRDRQIVVLQLTGSSATVTTRIPINGNPNKMVLNSAQNRLFVAVNNADTLLMIDTDTNRVVTQVNTTAPADLLGDEPGAGGFFKGSNPNSVTLSADEKTAYVTNGGTNSIAVISLNRDALRMRVRGLIPTGWQPNSVSVSPDGKTLYVVNGKSNPGPNPLNCRFINAGGNYGSNCQSAAAQNGSGNQYAFQNTKAGFLVLPVPGRAALSQLTGLVAQNNGLKLQLNQQDVAAMRFLREHIKHVIYIVKENRTYDQILGDLPVGNGDPTLTQFPQKVTPNLHAIASNFVDFDNFYDSGIVSMDGWQWSTAARALDINEKTVVVNYGKGGGSYDSEGTDRNLNVALPTVAQRQAWNPRTPSDPDLLPGTANEVAADGPDGEEGLGYIWDAAIRAGISVRNYGFFLDLGAAGGIDPHIVDPCSANPPTQVAFPAHPSLLKRTDLCFRGYNNAFPDFFRYKEWLREFKQQTKTNSFPAFEMVRFSHDHFGNFGTAVYGVNTPELQAADNDYAVGLLVDTIAHSPYANSTLVFVIEDDPQDGADHVSGQRSTGFIVGPYVKHGAVVSAHYATVNMLRTMEEVLGLSNLSVHDSGVPPMTDAFDVDQSKWTFSASPAPILLTSQLPLGSTAALKDGPNGPLPHPTHDAAWWEAKTKDFDFSQEDRIDSNKFNRIIWQGLMDDKPYPTTRSGADLRSNRKQLLKTAGSGDKEGNIKVNPGS